MNVLLGDEVTLELVGGGCAVNKKTRVFLPSKTIYDKNQIFSPYETLLLHSIYYVVTPVGTTFALLFLY